MPDVWLIKYEDADQPDEIFMGENPQGDAYRRFEQISSSWNATLFRKVQSNFPETPQRGQN